MIRDDYDILCDLRFFVVSGFYDGLAVVSLRDGSGFSYANQDGYVWRKRFLMAKPFKNGKAIVELFDGNIIEIDREDVDIKSKTNNEDLLLEK